MAKESGLRHEVLAKLTPLHAVAIESPIEPGTPDVNCTAGWIELKHLNVWPAGSQTVVQPRHFESEQRLWLRKRCEARGHAWLLLRVGREWCLVWGATAAKAVGVSWPRTAFMQYYPDRLYWPTPPSSTDLIRALLIRKWLP